MVMAENTKLIHVTLTSAPNATIDRYLKHIPIKKSLRLLEILRYFLIAYNI